MVDLTLKSSGNIQGNSFVVGSASLCNAKPQLLCGFALTTGSTAIFRDGFNGPVVGYANSVAMQQDDEIFPYPIFCANGIYVNQSTAAVNIVVYTG